jgi:hypothetical protein
MLSVVYDHEHWQEIIRGMSLYDFHHTYDYHKISGKAEEIPLLFHFQEGDSALAIPFLKRPIENTPYFDLTSVYGYAGPVSRNIGLGVDLDKLRNDLQDFLRSENIVSIFSRLHPYIPNQLEIIKGLGTQNLVGQVVNIDLTLDLEEQRAQYSKSTKNRTNKCRRKCDVFLAESEEDIKTFIDIYYENMDRVQASRDYYFPREYFFDFLHKRDFKTDILLIRHQETGDVIAGSMFVKTNSIVQFHLSGSRTDYLSLAPANLFIDEMRIRGTEQGFTHFNLGGGFGGKKDSLFDFKASFSKDYRDFYIWKYIVNPKVYKELSRTMEGPADSDYFPLYRTPKSNANSASVDN